MMLRKIIYAFLVSFVVATPSVVFAQSKSVATVSAVVGDVYVHQVNGDDDSQLIERGRGLYAGEKIITTAQASVTVNFFDLTRVVLDADSALQIKQFPQTMDKGNVVLELLSGGARVTSGIIAKRYPERFSMLTPAGVIESSQAQWVVQVCASERCDTQYDEYARCAAYSHPPTLNRQFVSVYKGSLKITGCANQVNLGEGESLFKSGAMNNDELSFAKGTSCQVVEQVPCFILLNDKLGRDRFRQFLPKLTPINGEFDQIEKLQKRPHKRPPTIRPRIDRPTRRP